MLFDIRYSLRKLTNTPGFTILAMLALGLGIAAGTSIFSVVNSVLLKPLPFSQPDRLTYIWEVSPRSGNRTNVVNGGNYNEWRDRNRSFERMAALASGPVNLTGEGEPEQVRAGYITQDFFALLGVAPALGRGFSNEEFQPNGPDVILLSDRLWRRRFGGVPDIVGKRVQVNGREHTVVGVAPAGFVYPDRAELWNPMAPRRQWRGRGITVIGHLKPDITLEQAQSEMESIMGQLRTEHPEFNAKWGINVMSMQDYETRNVRTALLVLLGAVAFVLLIACGNVANLMLVRAGGREREIAVRASIGAGRWDIARQLLVESILLSTGAGALGLLLSVWLTNALVALSPESLQLQNFSVVALDGRVLLFTLVTSLLTGVLFGLAPAVRALRMDLFGALKGARVAGGSMRGNPLRSSLVVLEVALSLILLAGAGLLGRSFMQLMAVTPGFEPDHTLTLNLDLSGRTPEQASQRTENILERVRNTPGVRAAGSAHFLPMSGMMSATGFRVAGRPVPAPGDEPVCEVSVITSGYFAAMGIPLLQGRVFDARDGAAQPPLVVISRTLAQRYFPGEEPVGKELFIQWGHPDKPYRIAGVVGDIHSTTLDKEPRPLAYIHNLQEPMNIAHLVIRTSADPMQIANTVKQQVRAVDANIPVSNMRSLDYYVSSSVARERFNTVLLGTFATLAVLLALIGVFGVISDSVSQRTREIGIRMALGARAGDVLRMVIQEGMLLAGAGILLGIGGALLLTRLLSSLLFGVKPHDVPTFVAVSALLGGAALIAAWLPARRAARVDPMIALRWE